MFYFVYNKIGILELVYLDFIYRNIFGNLNIWLISLPFVDVYIFPVFLYGPNREETLIINTE